MKLKLSKIANDVRITMTKHSPEILTGLGIAGMITTTVLAVKATPKAIQLIDEWEESTCRDHEKLPPIQCVKLCWKLYIPAAVTGAASVACLIGANSVSLRRNAALATAYKLSETALSEYREKVVETIGTKKEETVRDKVDKERIKKNPVSKNEVIITNKGDTLCYDYMSGRYFKSDIDQIKKAENRLNKRMLHDITGSVSLNELYDEFGLERIELGDYLGWSTEELIDIRIGSQISDDGRPCIVVSHNNRPRYDY